MKNLSSLLILSGALALSAASVGLVACSSSSNNNPPAGGNDASSSQDANSTSNNDAGSTSNTDANTSTGDSAVGPVCPAAPELYPSTDAGLYCPFSYVGDAGAQHCAYGSQMCCLSPATDAGPSDCEAIGSACANPSFNLWQCASLSDCAGYDGGGEPAVCCLTAGPAVTTNDAGCPTTYKTEGFDGMKCVAASACPGGTTTMVPKPGDAGTYTDYFYNVCESNADCIAMDAGSTCTPIKTSGTGIGTCQLPLK